MSAQYCTTLMLWVMSLPPDTIVDCLEQQRVWRGDLSVLSTGTDDVIVRDTYPGGTAYLVVHPRTCRVVGLQTGSTTGESRRLELRPISIGTLDHAPSRAEIQRILEAAGAAPLDPSLPTHAGAAALRRGHEKWPEAKDSTPRRVGDVTFFGARRQAPPKRWYAGPPVPQKDAWWTTSITTNDAHAKIEMARMADFKPPRALLEPSRSPSPIDRLEPWLFESKASDKTSAIALFDRKRRRFGWSAMPRLAVNADAGHADAGRPDASQRHVRGSSLFLLGACGRWDATCLTMIDLRTGAAFEAGLSTDAAGHARQIAARFENEDLILEPKANASTRFGRRRISLADVIHVFERTKETH
ncbi:MAG: hypothetical protein IPK13_18565 [Deltaproteobacteria bacterium]|nr:hypothetical protein [Deltaproteobacteria bacterium]